MRPAGRRQQRRAVPTLLVPPRLTGLVARNDATDVLSAIVASVAHKVLTLAGNQESYLPIAVALGAFRRLGAGLCFIEQHGHHHLIAGPDTGAGPQEGPGHDGPRPGPPRLPGTFGRVPSDEAAR